MSTTHPRASSGFVRACDKRIYVAAISLALAHVGLFTVYNFAFSGEATAYAKFVLAMIRYRLIVDAFASVALVVSVPVLWLGTWLQKSLATVFIFLATMVLAFGRVDSP